MDRHQRIIRVRVGGRYRVTRDIGGLVGLVAGLLTSAAGGGVVVTLGAGGGTMTIASGAVLTAVKFLHDGG
ncbi:hypothetical protein AB0M36_18115 [Actinoplanes sp. NPDC051346]|uniref:hypothetical protein n=1 Tax=Actinoplanes sp. NPDC051346 TaxID=3155048 RepID=UPI0034374E45